MLPLCCQHDLKLKRSLYFKLYFCCIVELELSRIDQVCYLRLFSQTLQLFTVSINQKLFTKDIRNVKQYSLGFGDMESNNQRDGGQRPESKRINVKLNYKIKLSVIDLKH